MSKGPRWPIKSKKAGLTVSVTTRREFVERYARVEQVSLNGESENIAECSPRLLVLCVDECGLLVPRSRSSDVNANASQRTLTFQSPCGDGKPAADGLDFASAACRLAFVLLSWGRAWLSSLSGFLSAGTARRNICGMRECKLGLQ
ncbi:hypothetical protein PO909_028625 [Leuciscus waleckii]